MAEAREAFHRWAPGALTPRILNLGIAWLHAESYIVFVACNRNIPRS